MNDVTRGCERCERTPGWERIEFEGVERLRRCGCWMAANGAPPSVPHEFREARWSTWQTTPASRPARAAAQRFLDERDGATDLYLCGSVGAGKTRLACTLLNEAWHAGRRDVAFARVPMLLYQLQPSAAAEDTDVFGRLAGVSLLVLDDLGAEREAATDFTRRTLLMLYEARHDAGRRTVWTSNKTPLEISEFMGDSRLSSRIVGRCRVVALDGPDWRLRRASRGGSAAGAAVHDGKAAAAGAGG